jgi:hypothetical protein
MAKNNYRALAFATTAALTAEKPTHKIEAPVDRLKNWMTEKLTKMGKDGVVLIEQYGQDRVKWRGKYTLAKNGKTSQLVEAKQFAKPAATKKTKAAVAQMKAKAAASKTKIKPAARKVAAKKPVNKNEVVAVAA